MTTNSLSLWIKCLSPWSHSKQTLDRRGVKTVNICTSTQDIGSATFAVTVSVDGAKLPLTLNFKGTQHDCIVAKELPTFSTSYFYLLQQHQKIIFLCLCWIHANANDVIGGWFNLTGWHGSWAHPWWMSLTLNLELTDIEGNNLYGLGGIDAWFRNKHFCDKRTWEEW